MAFGARGSKSLSGVFGSIVIGKRGTGNLGAVAVTGAWIIGAVVVGLAVVIYQPNPYMIHFGSLPLYYLAKLEARYFADAAHCELCKRGEPLEKSWV